MTLKPVQILLWVHYAKIEYTDGLIQNKRIPVDYQWNHVIDIWFQFSIMEKISNNIFWHTLTLYVRFFLEGT